MSDMHDVRLALDGAFETTRSGLPAPVAIAPGLSWWIAAPLVALVAFGAAAGGWFLRPQPSVAPRPVVRFELPPPAGATYPGANSTPRMAVSPDGRYLAFTVGRRDQPDQLWVRRLDALDARPLTNIADTANEPVQQPFWSPDSRFIGFFVDGALKKVDVAGGLVQTLCNVPGNNYGGTWSEDGTILFGSSASKGIQRVPASGGVAQPVTMLDSSLHETAHLWPRFLPDGRHFLYHAQGTGPDNRTIYAGSIGSPDRTLILKTPFMADFVQPGYLLFLRDDALLAQRFSVDTLKLEGEPLAVAERVQATIVNGRVGFTASGTGVLVYRAGSGSSQADSQLAWFDRTGREIGVVDSPGTYRGMELAADDRRAVVHREEADGGGLWVLDLDRGSTSRLTFDDASHSVAAIWSADDKRIIFTKLRKGSPGIFDKDASGVGDERLLHDAKSANAIPWSVSPDGGTLVLGEEVGGNDADLSILSLAGGSVSSTVLKVPRNQWFAQLSADGRWLAYASVESGRFEVYVQSFPKPDTRYQVSTTGGTQPRWRRDGRELFYVVPASGGSARPMMAVSVERAGSGLRLGIPQRLFDVIAFTPPHVTPAYNYDVTSDGQRFLVTRPAGASGTSSFEMPVTVVLNWDAAFSNKQEPH